MISSDDRQLEKSASKFKLHSKYDVKILHCNSIYEFYCIQFENVDYIKKVKEKLNAKYNDSSYESQHVYVPAIGMICAVNYNNEWHRCEIVKLHGDGRFTVILVDNGERCNVGWLDLRYLEDEFFQAGQHTMQMSLFKKNDSNESSQFDAKWALKEFKRICDLSIKATVKIDECTETTIIVTLSVDTRQTTYMVNTLLLNGRPNVSADINSDEAIQVSRSKSIEPVLDQQIEIPSTKIEKKIEAIVKHIVSPNEFYVVLAHRIDQLNSLHRRLQKSVADVTSTSKMNWSLHENCLVKYKLGKTNEWYRGTVIKLKENGCLVFLRDVGATVTANLPEDLLPDHSEMECPGAAMKCHLAFLEPTNDSSWSSTAIDKFKSYCERCSEMAITVPKILSVSASVPVILWISMNNTEHITFESAKSKWYNINWNLMNQGLAYPTVPTIDLLIDPPIGSCNDEENNKQLINELIDKTNANYDTKSDHKIGQYIPLRWKRATPITDKEFIGIPAFVDNKMIMTIHTIEQHKMLTEMSKKLTEWHKNSDEPDTITDWRLNEICIAKYLDGTYHRGEVKYVNAGEKRCVVSLSIKLASSFKKLKFI